MVLLPDNWNPSIYSLDTNGGDYNANYITRNDWLNILEVNGAVFLPAAGRRDYNGYNDNHTGYYWSATVYQQETAYYACFTGSTLNNTYQDRYLCHSVRLVQDY